MTITTDMAFNPLPFEENEFADRQAKLRASLGEHDLDAVLMAAPENMFYLTGYDTTGFHSFPQVLVFPREGKPTIICRAYELEGARRCFNLNAIGYDDASGPAKAVADALGELGIQTGKLAIEKNVPWLRVTVYEALLDLVHKATWSDGSGLVEEIRAIKSPAEIEYLRKAGKAVTAGMIAAIEASVPGNTDAQIAAATYQARLLAGSHHVRNPTYVVTGPRSAIAHQTWNGSTVQETDLVLIEFGANVRHYSAAGFHTVLVGNVNDQLKRALAAVLEARDRAVEMVRPGVAAEEVHHAAQKALAKAGFAEYQKSRTGYAMGIEFLTWIEANGLSLFNGDKRLIKENMSFHVLPHILIPGVGTIGFSRSVLCTAGNPEVFTDVPTPIV